MTDERKPNRVGPLIGALGYLTFLVFFLVNFTRVDLGPIGAFLGGSFLLPLALIVVGRSITRRSRRRSAPPDEETSPEPAAERRPRVPTSRPAPPEEVELEQVIPAPSPMILDDEEDEPPIADLPPMPPVGEFHPKSSEEMIAEAKRRLRS